MSGNGAFVKSLYDAAGRGEPGVLIGALDPKVDWRESEHSPYVGGNPYVGPAAVGGLLQKISADVEGFHLVVENVIDGGDTVAVQGRYQGKSARTGKALDAQFVHVWQLRGQVVTRFQQYTNTRHWAEVLGL